MKNKSTLKTGLKLAIIATFAAAACVDAREVGMEIELTLQVATIRINKKLVRKFPISSGSKYTPTPTGEFKVLRKKRTHFSTLYGSIVSATGRIVDRDANGFEVLPEGARFIPAPMHFFIEFERGTAIHTGTLPGYPASHGCVRLNRKDAEFCFGILEVGDPIYITGNTPSKGKNEKNIRPRHSTVNTDSECVPAAEASTR